MAASSVDSPTGGEATISGAVRHAPAGYLICNGGDIPSGGVFQGINASLLQNLRDFLGATYGATGRLPNLINNFIGYSAVPGTTGGSANSTLVSHNHTGTVDSAGFHSHTTVGRYMTLDSPGPYIGGFGGPGGYPYLNTINGAGAHTHTFTTGSTGSSGTNANLPPYVGMLPVIKY